MIEGLHDGGLAFYTKIHHATLDGASGVASQALLDLAPKPRKVKLRAGAGPMIPDSSRSLAQRCE